MDPNATTVERLVTYVQNEQFEEAETLAKLCDYLEECLIWDVSFEEE